MDDIYPKQVIVLDQEGLLAIESISVYNYISSKYLDSNTMLVTNYVIKGNNPNLHVESFRFTINPSNKHVERAIRRWEIYSQIKRS